MRRTIALFNAIALLDGCSDNPTDANNNQDLETLRRVMTPFQTVPPVLFGQHFKQNDTF